MTKKQFILFFLLPAIIILLTISVIPTLRAVSLAFQNRILRYSTYMFTGFENFKKLATDRRFWNSMKISLIWEIVTVIGTLLIGITLALFMYENISGKLKNVLNIILILPVILPRISAAYIWRFIYSPLLGIFNYFLSLIKLGPVEFLANPKTALLSVAVVDIWQWGLLFSVIILKLLDSLPQDPIEAAKIDGAKKWQIHIYITLPILVRPITSLTFVKMIESLRSFDLIYIMTKGGPGIKTETLDLYAYQMGIGLAGRISYASSMALLMLIATLIFFTIIWRKSIKWYSD
jgi:multiple sugar transport system permease protein